MSISQFKNIGELESLIHKIDGRVKTITFLLSIIISAVLSDIYVEVLLWIFAIILFSCTNIKWLKLLRRLYLPFGLSWLVFLSIIFTNGSEVVKAIHFGIIQLNIYEEGIRLGVLIQIRIMTAVTFGCVLAFTTPMIEILETLRMCKLPGTIVDIADMMYRYVFIVEETAHNMHVAQVSRMGDKSSWIDKVRDAGKVAAYVIIKSMDKSVKIYNAMLARGYNSNTKALGYFYKKLEAKDWIFGAVNIMFLTICIGINIAVR